jgi:hypothetical protein
MNDAVNPIIKVSDEWFVNATEVQSIRIHNPYQAIVTLKNGQTIHADGEAMIRDMRATLERIVRGY